MINYFQNGFDRYEIKPYLKFAKQSEPFFVGGVHVLNVFKMGIIMYHVTGCTVGTGCWNPYNNPSMCITGSDSVVKHLI